MLLEISFCTNVILWHLRNQLPKRHQRYNQYEANLLKSHMDMTLTNTAWN